MSSEEQQEEDIITIPNGDEDVVNTKSNGSNDQPTSLSLRDPSGRVVRMDSEAGGWVDADAAPPQRSMQPPAFPSAFYDPLTRAIMTHPVVNPAGDSYEQSTLPNDTSVSYYPNRALQAIIQRETAASTKSKMTLRASIRRLDSALHANWNRLVSHSVFPSNYKPLPETFYCPIMCELMVDPVIDPDGYTFERDAMEHWVRSNGQSPLTRQTMTVAQLRPNNAVYTLIQREKSRTPDSMHPSIRRWKDATDLTSRRPLTVAAANAAAAAASTAGNATTTPSRPATTAPSRPTTTTSRPTPTRTLPTTNADLLRQRRQRQSAIRNAVAGYVFLCSLVVVVLVLPFGFAILLFAVFTGVCCLMNDNSEPSEQSSGPPRQGPIVRW